MVAHRRLVEIISKILVRKDGKVSVEISLNKDSGRKKEIKAGNNRGKTIQAHSHSVRG